MVHINVLVFCINNVVDVIEDVNSICLDRYKYILVEFRLWLNCANKDFFKLFLRKKCLFFCKNNYFGRIFFNMLVHQTAILVTSLMDLCFQKATMKRITQKIIFLEIYLSHFTYYTKFVHIYIVHLFLD